MGVKEAAKAILANVPAPHDFLPSRFARKLSMAAGWATLALIVVLITDVSLRTWLTAHAIESATMPRGGVVVNVSITGTCSLRWCRFHRESAAFGIDEDVEGTPGDLTGDTKLNKYGAATQTVLVLLIVLAPVVALVCFYHGWGRIKDQRASYIAAFSAVLANVLLSMVAWVVYCSGVPRGGGYSVGDAFWLLFVVFFVYLALAVVVGFDKPSGLVRLTKEGVVKDRSWEESVVAAGGSAPDTLQQSLLQESQ